MKKKSIVLLVCAVLLLALVIAALWYTRPMSLWALSDSPDAKIFAIIDQWHAVAGSEDLADDMFQLALQPEDPEYQQLADLLSHVQVRRRLSALLPRATTAVQGKQMKKGMVNWFLHFSGVGLQYSSRDFYLSYGRYHFTCTVVNHDATAEELTEFLLQYSEPLEVISP